MEQSRQHYHKLPYANLWFKLISVEQISKYLEDLSSNNHALEIPEPGTALQHTLYSDDGDVVCLVLIGDVSEQTNIELIQLITHEGVHVKQEYMKRLHEDKPSEEFEAYITDDIIGKMLEDYEELTNQTFRLTNNSKPTNYADVAKQHTEECISQLGIPHSLLSESNVAMINEVGREKYNIVDKKVTPHTTDILRSISNWFDVAYPNPTVKNACVQIGVHYEEVAEMMVALDERNRVQQEVSDLADRYKSKTHSHLRYLDTLLLDINDDKKIELLDAMCDQIVTATGVMKFLGFDVIGALNEVNNSNWSKFEDGKAIYHDNGKVAKGADYFEPDLSKFINKDGADDEK